MDFLFIFGRQVIIRETGNLIDYMYGNDLAALRSEPSGNFHRPVAMTLVQR
jgi:hypothetical protein